MLIWAKWPFRIMHIASGLTVIYFIAMFKLGYEDIVNYLWILFPLIIIAGTLSFIGLFKLRFEMVDPDNVDGASHS